MQGHLTQTRPTARIESACHCCQQPIRLTVSSDAKIRTEPGLENILLFVPSVDWGNLSGSTIVHDY